MKKTSKIVLGIAMAATALTSLSGLASANEHEAVLSYNTVKVDVDGIGEFDGNGVTLESRGIYDNGLRYDLSATSADLDALDDQAFGELNLRYMPGTFGFASSNIFPDSGDNYYGLGVAAEYMAGNVEAYGTLTTDAGNFMEDFALELGGRYKLNPNAMLIAEYNKLWAEDDASADMLEMSMRYDLVDNTFIQAGYATSIKDTDAALDVYSLGLGLNF